MIITSKNLKNSSDDIKFFLVNFNSYLFNIYNMYINFYNKKYTLIENISLAEW